MIAKQTVRFYSQVQTWLAVSIFSLAFISCENNEQTTNTDKGNGVSETDLDAAADRNDTDESGEDAEVKRVCSESVLDPSALQFYSATRLADAIKAGEVTSSDLLELYLERIEKFNGEINAVVTLDIERARERAAAADQALAEGDIWGPLHGLPITIKDTYEVAGVVTTSGDPVLKDYVPETNAIAVQRLIDAGAIVFGKTNVPFHAREWQSYNDIFGTTNNPWDLDRTSGGSSGGAAAALAAGLTSLELGSDIGGSIRIPSHFNGVFGHKPTFGVVPRYGHIPPMPGEIAPELMTLTPLFVTGPLARSADDLLLAMDVLSTPGETESTQDRPELLPQRRQKFSDYRVAVWLPDPPPFSNIQDDVLEKLTEVVDRLIEAGLDVDQNAHPDIDLATDILTFSSVFDSSGQLIIPLPDLVIQYQDVKEEIWDDFFREYDVLLTPVTPTVAFAHDHSEPYIDRSLTIEGRTSSYPLTNLAFMTMAILAGLPATVAPIGISDSCLPVGIQIIGAKREDRTTIDFARGLSELVGGFVPPPDYD